MSTWQERSAESIKKRALTSRERTVPEPDVKVELEPGKVYPTAALPSIKIADGVKASVSWGRGTLLEWLEMAPGATYPGQSMTGELITAVQSGSATCTLDGQTLELASGSFLYLTEGMHRSLQAGPDGLVAMEVFSPVRVDHLALAGTVLPADADVTFADQGIEASLEPGKVYNYGDIPRKPILMPGRDPAAKPTAHTILMWGKNFMLSFIRMDGNSSFPHHFHPEDQLMIVLNGEMDEGIGEEWHPMSGANLDVILQPGGMVHAASISPEGVDVVDLFWPVRPDYMEMVK
jgi:gluconolactonase